MPIKAEMRWFYPIDWPQLSNHVRFERAGGICQRCASAWRTFEFAGWTVVRRDPSDLAQSSRPSDPLARPRRSGSYARTRVVLAAAHLDHIPATVG